MANDAPATHRDTMQSKGNRIMAIAEKLRPWLMNIFQGAYDENGMPLQPAHVRGIALNVAQRIVADQENGEWA